MSCCHPLLPFVQLGSARKAGNNAKEQKNALDAAQSQSESTSLASCRHPPPLKPLAGESTAAAKRIVLQITAGCAGGWAAGRTRPTVQCGGSSNDGGGGGVRRQTSFEWKCV